MQPTFSVVIPTHNRAHLFLTSGVGLRKHTVQCTSHNSVIDSASTDTRCPCWSSWCGGQIKLIQHPRNLERAAARNTGMTHATADRKCTGRNRACWSSPARPVFFSTWQPTDRIESSIPEMLSLRTQWPAMSNTIVDRSRPFGAAVMVRAYENLYASEIVGGLE